MKEVLYQNYKKLKWNLSALKRTLKRIFVKKNLTETDCYNVPIIINNRNRLTFLKLLLDWLQKSGYNNIYILDNDSTYPPLLEFYKTTNHKVVYLGENVGYKALWKQDLFKQFETGYYVYTDSDVIPTEKCPTNLIEELYNVLKRHRAIEKAGVSLKISDLPDSFDQKEKVIEWETKHWEKEIEKDLYDAPVDTTFALYRPYAKGEAEVCKAYRLGGKFTFLHLPWYNNSNQLPEEEVYYKETILKNQSHWIK